MGNPGTARIDGDAGNQRVVVAGDWTLALAPALAGRVAAMRRSLAPGNRIDASAVGRIDTAGASLLLDLAGETPIDGLDERQRALVDTVARAQAKPPAPSRKDGGVVALLVRTGAAVEQIGRDAVQLL